MTPPALQRLTKMQPSTADWRTTFGHTPMRGRTTDPQALKLDEAAELYYSGLRNARRGDLETGRDQIAKAFLINHHCMSFASVLPDPEAADLVVDGELIIQLIDGDSLAAFVLKIPPAFFLGSQENGQFFIALAMAAIEDLFKHIELHPEIESVVDENSLGGNLRRTTLLLHRAELYSAMGNRRLAIKDLTAALKIDPTFTTAREERAKLYAFFHLKDHRFVYAEFKRILSEVHEDHRENESNYAWLAYIVLMDHQLGTFEDAKRYYGKSLRAVARNKELYGPFQNDGPQVLDMVKEEFVTLRRNPDAK